MATQLLDEIHPGEILLEEFMKPLGIRSRRASGCFSLRRVEVLVCLVGLRT